MSDKQDSDFEVFLTMGEYRKFQNSEKQFNAEREAMNKQKAELVNQLKSKDNLTAELKKELAERNGAFSKISLECLKLKELNLALQQKITSHKLEIEKNKVAQLKNLEESTRQRIDLSKRMAELTQVTQNLQKQKKDLESALDQMRQSYDRLKDIHLNEIKTLQNDKVSLETQLTQQKQKLLQTAQALKQQKEQHALQLDSAHRTISTMEKQRQDLQMHILSVHQKLKISQSQTQQCKKRYDDLYTKQTQMEQQFENRLKAAQLRKQQSMKAAEPKSFKQKIIYYLELYSNKTDISDLRDHINGQLVLEDQYQHIISQGKVVQDKLDAQLNDYKNKYNSLKQEYDKETMLHKIEIDGHKMKQNALEAQLLALKKAIQANEQLLNEMFEKQKKEQSNIQSETEIIRLKDIIDKKDGMIKNIEASFQMRDAEFKHEIAEKNRQISELKENTSAEKAIKNYFDYLKKTLAEVEDKDAIINDEMMRLTDLLKKQHEIKPKEYDPRPPHRPHNPHFPFPHK